MNLLLKSFTALAADFFKTVPFRRVSISGTHGKIKRLYWAAATTLTAALTAACTIAHEEVAEAAREVFRSDVAASRLFAGPGQYPPEEFAAYGILAFWSLASSHDRSRHLMICEAYITSLPHASELDLLPWEQMVTVWPIQTDADANTLNDLQRDICEVAVEKYGLLTARRALKDAELAGADIAR